MAAVAQSTNYTGHAVQLPVWWKLIAMQGQKSKSFTFTTSRLVLRTFMQRTATCLASWFSVDGPLSPDCSAPLSVSQLTKLSTADSPLGNKENKGLSVFKRKAWQLDYLHLGRFIGTFAVFSHYSLTGRYRCRVTDRIPIWRQLLSLKRNFPTWFHKVLYLRQQTTFEHWTVDGNRTWQTTQDYCKAVQQPWQNGKSSWHSRNESLTSTMAFGSSSALNSCSMESMMFFQPSRRMLPCRWARSNTVLAAVCALLLLPNTVGRFSTDCVDTPAQLDDYTMLEKQTTIIRTYCKVCAI